MQDQMIIYDNEKQSIGWIPADCDELASLQASAAQVYEYWEMICCCCSSARIFEKLYTII